MKKILFILAAAISFFACQNKIKPTMPKKAAYDMYIGTYTHKEDFVDWVIRLAFEPCCCAKA